MAKEKVLPLELLKQINQKYPDCWKKIEALREGQGGYIDNRLKTWAEQNQIPAYPALAIASYGRSGWWSPKIVPEAQMLDALEAWRQSKEIFTFDEELAYDLFREADYLKKHKIPTEIFLRLPYSAIYIEIEGSDWGIFVHLENGSKDGKKKLRFLCLAQKPDGLDYMGECLEIGGNKSISAHLAQALDNLSSETTDYVKEQFQGVDLREPAQLNELKRNVANEMARALQLVLYLCSLEPDAVQNSKPVKRSKVIHDQYREVRKWNVGVRYGNAIRKFEQQIKSEEKAGSKGTGNHTPKRPHIRRGHYHHYWVGPRKSPKRHLELVWLNPMLVNADASEDLPATIHAVG